MITLKRTPLRRRTPMPRRRRPLRTRSPGRRPITPEDRARLEWLHSLPCCAPGAPAGCRGPATVHHDTQDRALGAKAPHSRGMPMCYGHGVWDFHGGLGPFSGWTRDRRRRWQTAMVIKYRAMWDALQDSPAKTGADAQ